MTETAIIVAANPNINYDIGNGRCTKRLGDVEYHKSHAEKHGAVFWDVIPSVLGASWNYPEIRSGYFYIAGEKKIKYRMDIERMDTHGEILH